MDVSELCAIAENEVKMLVNVLPNEVKQHVERCPVSFEGKPDENDQIDQETLGLFEGASLEEELNPEAMPRIRLFVENLWDYAERDEQDFRDEVGTTYLHELGHYLGWDEEEVADRGLE